MEGILSWTCLGCFPHLGRKFKATTINVFSLVLIASSCLSSSCQANLTKDKRCNFYERLSCRIQHTRLELSVLTAIVFAEARSHVGCLPGVWPGSLAYSLLQSFVLHFDRFTTVLRYGARQHRYPRILVVTEPVEHLAVVLSNSSACI